MNFQELNIGDMFRWLDRALATPHVYEKTAIDRYRPLHQARAKRLTALSMTAQVQRLANL